MTPALATLRAEKAALRMIAAESAIFVILDIVLSPSLVGVCSAQVHRGCEIPDSEVATMEALVKCGVVMVSIALGYHQISV
jgi:hypothetical protein